MQHEQFPPSVEGWRPPAHSLATRRISRRSKGSARPTLVSPDLREVDCESDLEGKVGLCLLAHSSVTHLVEQPEAVTYVDDRGTTKHHVFDFVATLRDGTRMAVVVKPSSKVERQGTKRLVEVLAAQVPASVATCFKLMTERHVPPDVVHDAQLINTARLHPVPQHDAVLRDVVAKTNGEVTVKALVALSGLGGAGFRSVVRLIADGTLARARRGRISLETVLHVPTEEEA